MADQQRCMGGDARFLVYVAIGSLLLAVLAGQRMQQEDCRCIAMPLFKQREIYGISCSMHAGQPPRLREIVLLGMHACSELYSSA